MPITQSRMISLLAAAQDYRQALDKIRAMAQFQLREAQHLRITYQEALNNINVLCDPLSLLDHPQATFEAIANEQAHFTPAILRSNDRQRRKMALKRGQLPLREQRQGPLSLSDLQQLPPHPVAPQALDHTSFRHTKRSIYNQALAAADELENDLDEKLKPLQDAVREAHQAIAAAGGNSNEPPKRTAAEIARELDAEELAVQAPGGDEPEPEPIITSLDLQTQRELERLAEEVLRTSGDAPDTSTDGKG